MSPEARSGGLRRFLEIARCPECFSELFQTGARLACVRGHSFRIDRLGIPVFSPTTHESRGVDRAAAEDDAAAYAAMRAFAVDTLGRGESEGLYRTVDDLLLRGLMGTDPAWILDVGCGTGRTVVDAASAFSNAYVIGLDSDPQVLLIAHAVARLRGPAVTVDLRRWGFGERVVAAHNLTNSFFVQALSERLPFCPGPEWPGFDAVTCVNLLDRVANPVISLREAARVLAPGGRLVLATPLNWRQIEGSNWDQLGTPAGLRAMVEGAGFEVKLAFDGLVYREILDVRGSSTDWQVAVISAVRAGKSQTSASRHSTLL